MSEIWKPQPDTFEQVALPDGSRAKLTIKTWNLFVTELAGNEVGPITTKQEFYLGSTPVNEREDGRLETVEMVPRILTRAP